MSFASDFSAFIMGPLPKSTAAKASARYSRDLENAFTTKLPRRVSTRAAIVLISHNVNSTTQLKLSPKIFSTRNRLSGRVAIKTMLLITPCKRTVPNMSRLAI